MKRLYKDNYEACYNAALECSSRSELQKKHKGAYDAARINGWLDDYPWLTKPDPPNKKWYYDDVYKEALKYKTKTQFFKGNASAYKAARINGWLDDYPWLIQNLCPYRNKKDNVYAYFFTEFNSVYVGRSIEPNKRDKSHRKPKRKSSVYKFAAKHNIPIPEMIILESNLAPNEGQVKEDYYVKKFKEEGWNILNIGKTGVGTGSLGAMRSIWTENKTYKEALKYESLNEFITFSNSAYSAAHSNGWLVNYPWLENSRRRPIVQITTNGYCIGFFNGGKIAAEITGFNYVSINKCCNGKQHTSGGYRWMFYDDYLRYY